MHINICCIATITSLGILVQSSILHSGLFDIWHPAFTCCTHCTIQRGTHERPEIAAKIVQICHFLCVCECTVAKVVPSADLEKLQLHVHDFAQCKQCNWTLCKIFNCQEQHAENLLNLWTKYDSKSCLFTNLNACNVLCQRSKLVCA